MTHHGTTHTTTGTSRRHGLFHRRARQPVTTTTTTPRRGLFHRRQRPVATTHHGVGTTHHGVGTTHHGVGTHHGIGTRHGVTTHREKKRHVGIGDKISGAFLRIKGTLTGRPDQKAAGARRMHGIEEHVSKRHRLLNL
ncbi:hypothetical protein QBC33DRAFT_555660 [Phialemonium atrogriseum]|uniref:Uncharacterized protein n=1 Tax=Phialemonium atrogriseum TaxID=1093897 RepID=A0AAJ0C7Y0_9PEZI|nr:uncharacterized protein QBC33DRAFT_555660 [Phialemonium atrogriseum]KAK1771167.1 hypothetical protein QBC33DRAFT_555660 [Phialemonium atrogriseum]